MNLNLAEMTVLALCYFLFKPFDECDAEDHIHLGQGFYEALPGLSREMREKVVVMARERLNYLNSLPPLPLQSEASKRRAQELAFLNDMTTDPDFFDKLIA